MDPPPGEAESGRRGGGRGGKGRNRLGLKKASPPAPSPPPASSLAPPVPPPSPISAPAAPTDTTAAPTATTASPTATPTAATPAPAVPGSSPAAPASTVPPLPWQGAGWGAIPPNFASLHGNLQGPNSWLYRSSGFLNMIQQQHYPPQPQVQAENFHLVGQTVPFNPISPPPPPSADGTEVPKAKKQRTIRYWTPEEEERLASAWLNASKDPIKGHDKRGDTFWKEIAEEFNKKGNGKPTRELNQLKIHWSRLKISITDFNDVWTKVTQMNTSGYSDDMHEEEAQKMYTTRFGKRFSLVHWWKILKDEPKWKAQFQETDKNSEVVDVADEQSRPIGREAAKAERNVKSKKKNIMEGIIYLGDTIEKIVKVNQDRKVEREKVTETQIEISNANLKAAKEQKEAKMFEVYNSLLNQDTSQMSEDRKANRDRAIRKLEEKLFAD